MRHDKPGIVFDGSLIGYVWGNKAETMGGMRRSSLLLITSAHNALSYEAERCFSTGGVCSHASYGISSGGYA